VTEDPVVRLTVNGEDVAVDVAPETPLIQVLRTDLGHRGVRAGCGAGFCGSCTVLVDGAATRSCDTPVHAVRGSSIVTPEGLGTPDQPHEVQRIFLEEQAAQCGYCINGIIMGTEAARARGDTPGGGAPDWLHDHLCRCGTHTRVLRAVDRSLAAASTRGGAVSDGSAPTCGRVCDPGIVATSGVAGSVGQADPGRIEAWVRLLPDGRIAALSGKVELGQGIRTAMAQIVAAQIGVAADRVVVVPTTTGLSPDEMYTAGSNSLDGGGAKLGAAAAAFARCLRERAAADLQVTPDDVSVSSDGTVSAGERVTDLAALAARGPISGPIQADDRVDWSAASAWSGPRADLVTKLTGAAAYVHDIDLPGMVHARAVLPPNRHARLEGLDVRAAEQLPGVLQVVVDGRLVIVIAEREEQAVRAALRLQREARWQLDPSTVSSRNVHAALRELPSERYTAEASEDAAVPTHRASFSVPYQAHASVAPSCAVAQQVKGVLRVHTHSQGVYPLHRSLAAMLEVAPEELVLIHADGPGCYGHNLADDAAALAALAARATGDRPVRFQFSLEDEFTWEPLGSAMVIDVGAALDAEGRLLSWNQRAITDTHTTRPNGNADRLLPSWLRAEALEPSRSAPHEGGARNASPIYDVPAVDAVADHVDGPLRTSALRTLGAYANTFAGESFIDELAEQASADPVAFRLRHLTDERARAVLQLAADTAAWEPHVGPSGRGRGIALSRYKAEKAYVAAVVDVSVDTDTAEIRVERILLACDAGAVINADGLANQLEGGALQGLSRAMYEEIHFEGSTVTSRDWSDYPTLGFRAVPEVELVVVDDSPHPPLGVGEASVGPVAAALANAIDDAIGVRLRDLPLTPERLTERLFALDDDEAARVLLG
jgi:nicotinate dehydrogenase subunit B